MKYEWLLLLLLPTACDGAGAAERGMAGDGRPGTRAASGDVLLPMPAMIERFQAEWPAVTELGAEAATSRDALIDAFVAAVADSSATALRALRLNAAEFGYLYFPGSRYTSAPYQLPPETLWLLIEQNGFKGELRLLRTQGGRAFAIQGYTCEAQPAVEGRNRYWEQCRLRVRDAGGQLVQQRFFGSIMERDGRFKFVSLANPL